MIAEKFKIIDDLGSGATAVVKLVEDITTGEKLACKILKNNNSFQITEKQLTDVQKEVSISVGLKNDNIINVKAVGRGMYDKDGDGEDLEEVLFIIMDYAQEGELFDMISNSGKFSERVARYYFYQIL